MRLPRRAAKALAAGQIPPASEDAIQSQIVQWLQWKLYAVLITSRRRKRCSGCGSYSHDGDGVSKGTPDLFVRGRSWPANVWLGLEVKSATGRYSCDEQRELAESEAIAIVRSIEDADRVIADYEATLQIGK